MVLRGTRFKGILLVPIAVRSPAPNFYPARQGFAIRSMAMALVMLLHLGLVQLLLRPPTPWFFRPPRSAASESALHIELLPHLRRMVVSKVVEHVAMHVAHIKRMTSFHPFAQPAAPANPSTPTPPVTESMPVWPAQDVPYGNATFTRAMKGAQSSGIPQIPGDNLVSSVPGIHVVPPPSLANRLRALGKLLNCKDAIFKGRMSDEELLKRGLTKQQMDQKYTELGCSP
jgi:hypothetical protein